jgi:hypothetical protein
MGVKSRDNFRSELELGVPTLDYIPILSSNHHLVKSNSWGDIKLFNVQELHNLKW